MVLSILLSSLLLFLQSQVFTIFVLPLNSCCNPFLYAILTKQFKKDCVMICKTIEESRVKIIICLGLFDFIDNIDIVSMNEKTNMSS